jgi:hypothetical protein
VPVIRYRLVVDGELGPLYATAFEEMELESTGGRTSLVGPVEDQAQLLGLVERVASLGLKLISVAPADPD